METEVDNSSIGCIKEIHWKHLFNQGPTLLELTAPSTLSKQNCSNIKIPPMLGIQLILLIFIASDGDLILE